MLNEPKEFGIRKLLWLIHHCGQEYLYGEDGEMQCHLCGLDFVRHGEGRIVYTFEEVGKLRYALQAKLIKQDEFDNSITLIRLKNVMANDK